MRQVGRRASPRVTMENGAHVHRAKVFADASYEGDLMAQARRALHLGPRGHARIRRVARRRPRAARRSTSSARAVSPSTAAHACCRRSSPRTADPVGAADKRVQAYNFRLCMTKRPSNRVAVAEARAATTPRRLRAARAVSARPSRRRSAVRSPINDVMKADIASERQDRHEQQRRLLHRLHRRQLRLPEGSYATRARDPAGARRLHPGLPVFPRDRPARSRGALGGDEGVGPLPRRVHRHRSLAASALRPRGAPHDRRIRHVAEGHPDRADQAGRHRHGVVQQRLAQRPAHARPPTARRSRTKATCRCASRRTRFRTG